MTGRVPLVAGTAVLTPRGPGVVQHEWNPERREEWRPFGGQPEPAYLLVRLADGTPVVFAAASLRPDRKRAA